MKKIISFLLSFIVNFCCFTPAQAQVNIKLTFKEDTLDFVSIWDIDLEISNNSGHNIISYPLSKSGDCSIDYGEVFLEVKSESDSIWMNANSFINNHFDLYSISKDYLVTLNPNQVIKNKFSCQPPFEILKFGRVKVRAMFTLYESQNKGQDKIVSNPVDVYINSYKNTDLSAFMYLNNLNRLDFLLSPLLSNSGTDSLDFIHAEYIVKNFPSSVLSSYASLFLTSSYVTKAYHFAIKKPKDERTCLMFLRAAKKYGFLVTDDQNLRIRERTLETLRGLESILSMLYDYSPPYELEKRIYLHIYKVKLCGNTIVRRYLPLLL